MNPAFYRALANLSVAVEVVADPSHKPPLEDAEPLRALLRSLLSMLISDGSAARVRDALTSLRWLAKIRPALDLGELLRELDDAAIAAELARLPKAGDA